MSVTRTGNKLDPNNFEKWGSREWEQFLHARKDALPDIIKSNAFQKKLMEEAIFKGSENYKRVPCRFPCEIDPSLEGRIEHAHEKTLKPCDYRHAPFALTRVVFQHNSYPTEGVVIQNEVANHPLVWFKKKSHYDGSTWTAIEEWGETDICSSSFGWHYDHHEMIFETLWKTEKHVKNTKIVSYARAALSAAPLPPPVASIVLNYLRHTPYATPSIEEQMSAERMKEMRFVLYDNLRDYVYCRDRTFKCNPAFEKIAGTIAQYLDGTDIDTTSPEDLGLAAERDIELPLHLKILEVNARDERGMTALHWAALKGHTQAVRTLIQKGADCNLLSQANLTPLAHALDFWYGKLEWEISSTRYDTDDNYFTNLKKAETLQAWEGVGLLRDKTESRPLKLYTDKYGNSIAHRLVLSWTLDFSKKRGIIRYLQSLHADLCTQNKDGQTPLHLATHRENSAVIMQMIATYAEDYFVKDHAGNTPLTLMLYDGSPEYETAVFWEEVAQLKDKIRGWARDLARFLS